MTTLPDKPSELIMLALEDIAAVERLPDDYVIDMSEYHVPGRGPGGECAVCFAGSVMAMSDGFGLHMDFADTPDRGNDGKYFALNSFRLGRVKEALEYIDIEYDGDFCPVADRYIESSNYDNPCSFRRDMIKLASELASVGL